MTAGTDFGELSRAGAEAENFSYFDSSPGTTGDLILFQIAAGASPQLPIDPPMDPGHRPPIASPSPPTMFASLLLRYTTKYCAKWMMLYANAIHTITQRTFLAPLTTIRYKPIRSVSSAFTRSEQGNRCL